MKDHARAGADVHRSRASRSRSAPTSTRARRRRRTCRSAMTFACLNLGLTPDEALAAVTINAALAVGLGEEIGSLEEGKAADLVVWECRLAPVPVLAGAPTWSGRSSSAAASSTRATVAERRSAPSALGLLAARLEQDHRRLGRQAEIVTVSLGCGGRARHPSRAGTSPAPRRMPARPRRAAWRRRSRGRAGRRAPPLASAESVPPIGTQATSTVPISPSFSSVRRWPMSPRWIVCSPSSSTTNAVCLPRSAPFASSR